METNPLRGASQRILVLITTPKRASEAEDLFRLGAIPIGYRMQVRGTANSALTDLLGLSGIDKALLAAPMPKRFADAMLVKLRDALGLGGVDSGIAFTIPLSGVNNLILKAVNHLEGATDELGEEGEEPDMPKEKYAMIAAVINQGYSEDVMNAAREAGASGGSVLHSRRIGNEELQSFWGFGVQEEKEIVLILVPAANKLGIMQSISHVCGVRTPAKGIVLSLPVDSVMGLKSMAK